ncbi:MAG: rhomboid family intramembrane serine protease [Gammaproteobacteria bacterium]|nr:rhomboid family intramembrane serine protease [Gammaproteobacteria bacterium]
MLFFPFKADLSLFRFPFITIAICILCLLVYNNQFQNERRVVKAGTDFCEERGPQMWRMVMDLSLGDTSANACAEMMWTIHLSDHPQTEIDIYAAKGKPFAGLTAEASLAYKREVIIERYQSFRTRVPQYTTQQLWYQPYSWDPWHMLTAAFAHGSWDHVIGNLFFFFAFAATVEVILGSLVYAVVVVVLALGTHAFYSVAMLAVPDAVPTVGLSGVVMGMMAMFAFFLPLGRIKCFLWFLVIIRIIPVPAWILAGWYIGWDVLALLRSEEMDGVNIIAHVSGAAIGYMLGVLFFRARRAEVRALL